MKAKDDEEFGALVFYFVAGICGSLFGYALYWFGYHASPDSWWPQLVFIGGLIILYSIWVMFTATFTFIKGFFRKE